MNELTNALDDALIVADDARGYPLDVLEARLILLENYPAIRRQLVDEIARRRIGPIPYGTRHQTKPMREGPTHELRD